ncbi:radical SAM protein [Candidatus Woesearchaeota archaeon]|nr:radical SAM protein [Candidatus Woesearchaeota archaeon]
MKNKTLINITKESGIPLIGCIAFGIIDRGTNLIQIRPTSICNLCCPFCSTDSGKCSKRHQADYNIDLSYLIEWVKEVVDYKNEQGCSVEANIDSVGETTLYPDLIELVKKLNKIKGIHFISMQTNASFLTKEMIDKLIKAGLGRINLSIHTLDKELGKKLAGVPSYDVSKIIELCKYISKQKIELFLTPVWMPKINDKDIIDIIKLAKELNVRLGIQKYETYKYSRKIKGAKELTYWKFYDQLKKWEKEFKVDLILTRQNMNIKKCQRLPSQFKKGDKVNALVKCPGWINGQMIGVAGNRCISINNCTKKPGQMQKVKILEDKNNIFLAE